MNDENDETRPDILSIGKVRERLTDLVCPQCGMQGDRHGGGVSAAQLVDARSACRDPGLLRLDVAPYPHLGGQPKPANEGHLKTGQRR
jgi:hypothetical protein